MSMDLKSERPKRSLWQKIVDVALTDARTLQDGIDDSSIEALERTLLESDFGVPATMDLVAELEGLFAPLDRNVWPELGE